MSRILTSAVKSITLPGQRHSADPDGKRIPVEPRRWLVVVMVVIMIGQDWCVEISEIVWWILATCRWRAQRGLNFPDLLLAFRTLPEHLSPWWASPWSIEPQWSQKVGVRNVNTSHLCFWLAWEQERPGKARSFICNLISHDRRSRRTVTLIFRKDRRGIQFQRKKH